MTEKRNEKQNPTDSRRFNRRHFLQSSAFGAACFLLPGSVLGKKGLENGEIPPSERLNIAGVGVGVRGLDNLRKCQGHNIAALCDVDWAYTATAFQQFPEVPKYNDFRKMLDHEKEIDAVIVSTPDHTHAVVAAHAMKKGKHVFVETPLAHDVWEAGELARVAEKTGVCTQMGNERHSGRGMREAVEMIWGGGLGPIREVHCWTNRPQWPQSVKSRPAGLSPPPELDWDLWLGPAPERSYNPAYHPYRWRGWIDFGTGALGNMGCQLLDVAFWGLKLGEAESFEIKADCEGRNEETYPETCTVRYRFPERRDFPPVQLTWYDGGRQPACPEGLPYKRELGSNGILFVGEQHSMLFGPTAFGTNPGQVGPRTIPEFTEIKGQKPYQKIPRVKEGDWKKGDRHINEWLDAIKRGTQPSANIQESAPLAEMVLIGNVAVLTGEPISWESGKMRLKGSDKAQDLLRRKPRKGWS